MNLSSLINMNMYHSSLADFLGSGKNKANDFTSISQGSLSLITARAAATAQTVAENTGVNINLSEDAQRLLTQAKGADGKSAVTGVQKIAQNFMVGFFDDLGVNFRYLSSEAMNLITGMQDVIAGSDSYARDITTDMAEMRYADGIKKVYTLTGPQSRLRLAIEYEPDGTTPKKLSVTDIHGTRVETAEISLKVENGKLTHIDVSRSQREYKNGHMVTLEEIEPLSIKLYTSTIA